MLYNLITTCLNVFSKNNINPHLLVIPKFLAITKL